MHRVQKLLHGGLPFRPADAVGLVEQFENDARLVGVACRRIMPEFRMLLLRRLETVQIQNDVCATTVRFTDDGIHQVPVFQPFVALPFAAAAPEFVCDGQPDDVRMPLLDRDLQALKDVFSAGRPLERVDADALQPDLLSVFIDQFVAVDAKRGGRLAWAGRPLWQ